MAQTPRDEPASTDAAHAIQSRILLAGTAIYIWYSLQFVGDYWFRPVIGALCIGALYTLGEKLGANHRPGPEPLLGFFAAMAVFAMPVASAPSPRGHGFVAAAIGAFVAQGAWALHRYPYEPTRQARGFISSSRRERMRKAATFGAVCAILLTLYVAVIFGIAIAGGEEAASRSLGLDFLWIAGSYLAAGVLAGAFVGLLAPIVRWPLGAMLLGIPLTGIIYGTVMIAMRHMEMVQRDMDTVDIPIVAGVVILTFIGPMWGIMMKEWIEE